MLRHEAARECCGGACNGKQDACQAVHRQLSQRTAKSLQFLMMP